MCNETHLVSLFSRWELNVAVILALLLLTFDKFDSGYAHRSEYAAILINIDIFDFSDGGLDVLNLRKGPNIIYTTHSFSNGYFTGILKRIRKTLLIFSYDLNDYFRALLTVSDLTSSWISVDTTVPVISGS